MWANHNGKHVWKLGKDTDVKIQDAQRTPIRFNKNRPSTRHIRVKFTKYSGKERIMKTARGKKKKFPNLKGKTDQVQQTYPQELGRPESSGGIYSVCWIRKICGGAWVAKSVRRPILALVVISRSVSLSPSSGSVLTAQSLEPASDSLSLSLSLSAPPLLMLCLPLSLKSE